MRSASALTGRTTERVTHSARPSAANSAISVMIVIWRVPADAAERAFCTPAAANWCDASISRWPATSRSVSSFRTLVL